MYLVERAIQYAEGILGAAKQKEIWVSRLCHCPNLTPSHNREKKKKKKK